MPKLLMPALLALAAVRADAAPPSAESVEKLLAVTKTESMIDSMYAGAEQAMRQSMRQAVGDRTLSAEQQRVFDALPARFTALLRSEMSWSSLRPQYVQLYRDTFDQEEIDGLLRFYQSKPGQAFVSKMPLVMQKSMAIAQSQMQSFLPKMQRAVEDAVREARLAR